MSFQCPAWEFHLEFSLLFRTPLECSTAIYLKLANVLIESMQKKKCCVCDFWIRKLLALKNDEQILAFLQTPNSTELFTLNHFESNLLSLDLISFLNDVVCQKKKKCRCTFKEWKVNVTFFFLNDHNNFKMTQYIKVANRFAC